MRPCSHYAPVNRWVVAPENGGRRSDSVLSAVLCRLQIAEFTVRKPLYRIVNTPKRAIERFAGFGYSD